MSQILMIVAASVFLLMGGAHGILALKDLKNPRAFTPRDPELRKAMRHKHWPSSNHQLMGRMMGFNLTHSLGLVLFGAAFLHAGVFEPMALARSLLLQACAVVVSAICFVLCLGVQVAPPRAPSP